MERSEFLKYAGSTLLLGIASVFGLSTPAYAHAPRICHRGTETHITTTQYHRSEFQYFYRHNGRRYAKAKYLTKCLGSCTRWRFQGYVDFRC